ncbi:glycosyltransferase family 25 protein [Vibrio cholerae]
MKIIVISLARATERRASITQQLDALGLEYELFDAIDAANPNFKHCDMRRDAITKRRLGYTLLDAEIACYASHYEVWQRCYNDNQPYLVIEDNALINTELVDMLTILHDLTKRYHYLKLFAYFPRKGKVIERLSEKYTLQQSSKRYSGAQGYALSPYAAKQLVSASRQGFLEAVDDYMEKRYRHGIACTVVQPNLIVRAPIKSTISNASSIRKNKAHLTFLNKIQIELFRLYERIRNRL